MQIPTHRKAVADRSRDISDRIVAHLEAHGPTAMIDLARLVQSSPNTIGESRCLYNLRLSADGHPTRIHTRLEKRRAIWFLKPAPARPLA